MKFSSIVNELMFDYADMSTEEINRRIEKLPNKILRWIAANHPDNRTRKIFFRRTNVKIGRDTVININFFVSDDYEELLTIGDRVAISPNVTVVCASAPNNSILKDHRDLIERNIITASKVTICDDVWIGAHVTIMPGVTIGRGSIIGAGAVVTRNVEPFTVAAGIPARKIRTIEIE